MVKIVYYYMLINLLAFIPLVFNNIHFDAINNESQFAEYLQSNGVFITAVATLSSVLTLLADLIMDCFSSEIPQFIEYRFLSLFCLAVFDVVLMASRDHPNIAQIFQVISYWHLSCEISIGMSFMNEISPKIFTRLRCFIVSTLFLISMILIFIQSIEYNTILGIIFLIVLHGCEVSLLYTAISWLYNKIQLYYNSNLQLIQYLNTKFDVNDFCVLFVIIFVGIDMVLLFNMIPYLFHVDYAYPSSFNENSIIVFNILRYLIAITINGIPTRVYREKSIRDNENLKTSKEMVQYIQHEIRGPIGVLQMGVKDIERSLTSSSSIVEFSRNTQAPSIAVNELVPQMRDSIICMKDVLDDMILYESLKSNTCKLEEEQVVLADFVVGSFGPYQSEAEGKGVDFKVLDIEDSVANSNEAILKVDVKKLDIAFRPFMLASIRDHNIQRRKIVNLEVKLIRRSQISTPFKRRNSMISPTDTFNSDVHFTIKDYDTHEIADDVAKLLKNASFQREAKGDNPAIGIGWWISQQIINLHLGLVEVSQFNYGSTTGIQYKITIPAIIPSDIVIQPRLSLPDIHLYNAANAPTNNYHVLVVDDSKLNRKMLIRTMRSLDHTCDEASDGVEAVDMVRRSFVDGNSSYDVILLDNEMPTLKGSEAVKIMREIGYLGIVLGVTGNALRVEQDEFVRNGADLVLLKPMDVEDFLGAIKQAKSRDPRVRLNRLQSRRKSFNDARFLRSRTIG